MVVRAAGNGKLDGRTTALQSGSHPGLLTYRRNTLVALTVCFCSLSWALATESMAHSTTAAAERKSASTESQNRTRDGERKSGEAQNRLNEVERKRKDLQARLSQARRKEQIALTQLRKIEAKLNVTTGALHESKHQLKRTENKLSETERGLEQTKSTEASVTDQACKRLREIYEGQRLSLLEMFFHVDSLQALLDLFYYQERVAEMDRKLINQLRAQEAALAARRNRLGEQKLSLGDLVSDIAKQAMAITKQKLTQEQIAEKLSQQREFYEQAEQQLARDSYRLEQQIRDMESSSKRKDMAHGSGTLNMPLRAGITSPFGWRRHPIFGVRKFHTGIDLAGPNHSAIRAADSGNVLKVGWYGGYGKVVIVSHGKGMATLYAHLCRTAVSEGDNVGKGDVIGYEGTTGFSTGPHLHFEVRVNGKPNNPLNYVQ